MNTHEFTCPTCGAIIDIRNPGQVLSHGWLNKETGQYECSPVEVEYSGSREVGKPVMHTKDGKQIDLN